MRPLRTILNHRTIAAACLGLLASAAGAAELPEGTRLQARLTSKVASNAAKAGDAVETVITAPVAAEDAFVLAAGSRLHGKVKSVTPAKPDARAILEIRFDELATKGGLKLKVEAVVDEVDNARETVDKDGRITGILGSETISARMDQGLAKLSGRFAKLADILGAAKGAVVKAPETNIIYEPGVEFIVKLTRAVKVDRPDPPPDIPGIEPLAELEAFVNAQPFQTTAEKPPKPSDITNLMFLGTAEQISDAFHAAGWSTAAELNAKSGLETFAAIAEQRGYKEAPMSILLLDGQKPDMVFQKQHNTFAERHHLRIWKRPQKFQGREVWACAATHDTGIEFSPENRTFIHKIDGKIDGERAKVVTDLIFGGRVKGLAFIERPAVPRNTSNATGDKIETDAAMAVLVCE